MEHPHPRHKINHDTYYRLADMQRGRLNAQKDAITSPTFAQRWLLDAAGNWGDFKQDDGDGTWNLDQDRTANTVNEITDVTETAGPSWATPAYSHAGNMTTVPQPVDPTASYAAAFDAWNRLVKLTAGANTVQENEYDGLRRRTVRKNYVSGSLDETRHFYYSDSWQVLEERLDSSTDPDRQFVWGLRYIDDCVLRDRDTNADGTLDERFYALQDANWNVTAVADAADDVQERYAYQPYGQPLFLDPAFVPQSASRFDWERLFAGYRWDQTTGIYLVRNRALHPALGVWTQRDPIGYEGAINLYQILHGNPIALADPSGLLEFPPIWPPPREFPLPPFPRLPRLPRPRLPRLPRLPRFPLPWGPRPPKKPPEIPTEFEWQKKCLEPDPQRRPTNWPPQPGDPCYYPDRKVRFGSWYWESQCVCQCMGDTEGQQCMRGCIRCADDHGAPKHTIDAEEWCRKYICAEKWTLKDQEALVCCTTMFPPFGGCRGTELACPKDPPTPKDRRCADGTQVR
jgi:RHS repeat-associated protein